MPPPALRLSSLRWASLAALIALAWIAATVHLRYRGNWTGLFCIGSVAGLPPDLRHQNLYIFPDSAGYDGQFYLSIAHDPFFRRGYAAYIDGPRWRYRRILVPLAAWILALGHAPAIPYTYVAIVILSVLAGSYWAARFTGVTLWTLGFLLLPAVLISLDRMTVDATLAALTAGFARYARAERQWKLYPILVLAPLVRETGFLLIAAFCLWKIYHRDWRRAALFATSALPALFWIAFVHLHTAPEPNPAFTWIPLRSWIEAFLHPLPYTGAQPVAWLVAMLDRAGLLGALLAILYAPAAGQGPLRAAALLFAALAIWNGFAITWLDAYAYPRSYAPLFLLVALHGRPVPAALPLPRTLLQLAGQLFRALKPA